MMAVLLLLRRQLLKLNKISLKLQRRNAYIVLLPEIPEDTPLTNPILQYDATPHFKNITLDNCINGIGKMVIEYECNLERFSDKIKESKANVTFSSVIEPLEKLSASLDYVWSAVKVLYFVRYAEEMAQNYTLLHQRVQKAKIQRFQSLPIYHAVKELNADKIHLTDPQQRVVNKYLLESKLNGMELSASQKEHLNVVWRRLALEKDIFRKKVQKATNDYSHVINDKKLISSFPSSLQKKMAVESTNPSKGPWEISLKPHIYHEFMKYCSDPELRFNTWQGYVTRASGYNDSKLNTSLQIEEIRFQRRDEANLLGYKTYADMSMETKMAGSVETVMSMIATLYKWGKSAADEEISDLQEYAAASGFKEKLQMWDIPYWRQRQKLDVFNLDEENLRQYFPLPKVMEGLFTLCKNLFGVSIKDATHKAETWHETVRYYEVYDDGGSHYGSFYFDPYYRSKGKIANVALLECGVGRSDVVGSKPVAYLILNLYPPIQDYPSLLSFEDVTIVFEKFGHCLQHVLTTVPYSDVSGLTNVEWDAINICPQFMVNILNNEKYLKSISSHYRTGESLSDVQIENLFNAQLHMTAYDLVQELYLSALDLQLYSSKEFWRDIMKEIWSQYMLFPQHKKDCHPTAFTTIFSDDFPAAYYSCLWSKMIAADISDAFLNEDEEQINQVGHKFRETFLSFGGGCHPSELFRRFRGRNPSPDSFLKKYRLKK